MLSGVLQPGGQVVEGVPPGYVVYKERPCGPPVVGAGDRSECLLSSLRIWGLGVTREPESCGRYLQQKLQTYGGKLTWILSITYCVPDLKLNLLSLDVDHPGPELHTNHYVLH